MLKKSDKNCFEYDGAYILISENMAEIVYVREGQVKSSYFKLKIPKRLKRHEIIYLG
jgi:hypothetical protein